MALSSQYFLLPLLGLLSGFDENDVWEANTNIPGTLTLFCNKIFQNILSYQLFIIFIFMFF